MIDAVLRTLDGSKKVGGVGCETGGLAFAAVFREFDSGPDFIFIYINNLLSNNSITNVTLFADSTTALAMTPKADQLDEKLKNLLIDLENWFNEMGSV